MVEVAESRAAIDALIGESKRITANWALSESKLPKDAIKVLLNLAHIAIDALIRGGTLDIGAERRDGASEIVVRASGPRLAFDEEIGHALQGEIDPDQLTGRTAPAHMLYLLADKAGGGLQYQLGDGVLVLGAVLPEPEGLIG